MSSPQPGPSHARSQNESSIAWQELSNYTQLMEALIEFMNESFFTITQVKQKSGIAPGCNSPVSMTEEDKQGKIQEIIAQIERKNREMSILERQQAELSGDSSGGSPTQPSVHHVTPPQMFPAQATVTSAGSPFRPNAASSPCPCDANMVTPPGRAMPPRPTPPPPRMYATQNTMSSSGSSFQPPATSTRYPTPQHTMSSSGSSFQPPATSTRYPTPQHTMSSSGSSFQPPATSTRYPTPQFTVSSGGRSFQPPATSTRYHTPQNTMSSNSSTLRPSAPSTQYYTPQTTMASGGSSLRPSSASDPCPCDEDYATPPRRPPGLGMRGRADTPRPGGSPYQGVDSPESAFSPLLASSGNATRVPCPSYSGGGRSRSPTYSDMESSGSGVGYRSGEFYWPSTSSGGTSGSTYASGCPPECSGQVFSSSMGTGRRLRGTDNMPSYTLQNRTV